VVSAGGGEGRGGGEQRYRPRGGPLFSSPPATRLSPCGRALGARVELRARNVRVIHERGRDKCHSAALCAARVYESRARIVARTVAQRTTSARSRACGSSLRRFSVSRDPATYPNLTFPRFHESNRVESSRSDRSRQPASDGKRVTYVSDILCRAQA